IPGRTGINMLPVTMAKLAKHPNILGVKEATGDLNQVSKIIQSCGEDFLVLSGEDALTFPMLCLGAQGAISVTANLMPKECRAMWEAIQKQDLQKARELHFKLSDLNEILFIETNPAPVKAALAMMGKISQEIRKPLVDLEEANKTKLKDVLKQYQLI
ncbi:MAG: dihydrodipicolinate synthase family protein, partial [Deltaproteobacteria bacterium]|nr:dihydrodipicolinate synthase family protein [Deltaproteobacteria bacterium]